MKTFSLSVQSPFDWVWMLDYLRQRAFLGVEWVAQDAYFRTVDTGWIKVQLKNNEQLSVEVYGSASEIISIKRRLQNLFDLQADPLAINHALGSLANQLPGIRLPGAFNGFEVAVRAILGQQITVKAATTLSGRFSQRFGAVDAKCLAGAPPQLTAQFPTCFQIAQAQVGDIAQLGIIARRAHAIILLAQALACGELKLDPVKSELKALKVIEQLCDFPGIGPWTAHYMAMRALKWSDALPAADVALYKVLGVTTPKQVTDVCERYRPYRGYAVMHIWSGQKPNS
jgi:AraC family transcriptional regulator, regulatory protein of adaptative response / DNA-3-methyladenine glycosylase II